MSASALRSSAVASATVTRPAKRAPHTRSFGSSASSSKALPFSLRPGPRTADKDASSSAQPSQTLRMIMFGKPGAGKGTLSGRLLKKYDNILSLSTGDMLRQHIAERTEVGQAAEEIVAKGGLIPDDIMLQIVTTKLEALNNRHWILDGFPRTLAQGQLLDAHLRKRHTPLNIIVNLDVPDQVILDRIADRWVHLPSGRVYNMSYNQPKVPGLDDETGEPLTKRPDDNPETFSRRLEQFYASTSPLLDYYSAQSATAARLYSIRGETSDEIWPQLDALVAGSFPSLTGKEVSRAKALAEVAAAREPKVSRSTAASSL